MRGAVWGLESEMETSKGRSPRARGSPNRIQIPRGLWRSIPACAGQSSVIIEPPDPTKVDPRVRGAVATARTTRFVRDGRSPRARGSPRYSSPA